MPQEPSDAKMKKVVERILHLLTLAIQESSYAAFSILDSLAHGIVSVRKDGDKEETGKYYTCISSTFSCKIFQTGKHLVHSSRC